MSEQRCGLCDACVTVLAVPAEYASANSGSGNHPQQYYLHHLKLMTFEEKDFFPIIEKKIANFFFLTHLSEIISPDWTP